MKYETIDAIEKILNIIELVGLFVFLFGVWYTGHVCLTFVKPSIVLRLWLVSATIMGLGLFIVLLIERLRVRIINSLFERHITKRGNEGK